MSPNILIFFVEIEKFTSSFDVNGALESYLSRNNQEEVFK